MNLPKISIVVPCLNMELYIEQTIKSIINQEYPNLELIIMDGGSSDSTLKILDKYNSFTTILISEKDGGQYKAVQKGMSLATGEILAWINADDIYYPWTLQFVSKVFLEDSTINWIGGIPTTMNEKGEIEGFSYNTPSRPKKYIQKGWFKAGMFGYLQQEGMFWSRELWNKSGGLDTTLKLAADYQLWIKFSNHAEMVSVGVPFACFRIRNDSRSRALETNYKNEVNEVSCNFRKPNILFRLLSTNKHLNILARKLTFKRSLTYKYYKTDQNWRLQRTCDSTSSHTLSTILSEIFS